MKPASASPFDGLCYICLHMAYPSTKRTRLLTTRVCIGVYKVSMYAINAKSLTLRLALLPGASRTGTVRNFDSIEQAQGCLACYRKHSIREVKMLPKKFSYQGYIEQDYRLELRLALTWKHHNTSSRLRHSYRPDSQDFTVTLDLFYITHILLWHVPRK